MAIVQKNEKEVTAIKQTFIARDIEVQGNFKGEGAIQIEGQLTGDIVVDSVVIGEHGLVKGNISAKSVIINGKYDGDINCISLDIMKNGRVSTRKINLKNIMISGSVKGDIIASGSLEVDVEGSIEGNITFDRIQINEGAKIVGLLKEFVKKDSKRQ